MGTPNATRATAKRFRNPTSGMATSPAAGPERARRDLAPGGPAGGPGVEDQDVDGGGCAAGHHGLPDLRGDEG